MITKSDLFRTVAGKNRKLGSLWKHQIGELVWCHVQWLRERWRFPISPQPQTHLVGLSKPQSLSLHPTTPCLQCWDNNTGLLSKVVLYYYFRYVSPGMVPQPWNTLPTEVRSVQTLLSFRPQVKIILFAQAINLFSLFCFVLLSLKASLTVFYVSICCGCIYGGVTIFLSYFVHPSTFNWWGAV